MRSFLLSTLALGALFLAGVPVNAATITYTATGVYDASVPTSFFTAPGATFTIQFTIDQNPTLISKGGVSFWPSFTNFHYFLNGVDLDQTASAMYFYSLSALGMFSVSFNPTVNPHGYGGLFYFAGPQMYSGTTASPTMLTGSFQGDGSYYGALYVNGSYVGAAPSTLVTGVLTGAPVPEPASSALLFAPLALLCLRMRTRKA